MEEEECDRLELTMHPDEELWTMQIGHLNDLYGHIRRCELSIPPNVPHHIRADNIRLLFVFRELRDLKVYFTTDDVEIEQKLIAALAELIMLTKLELHSGKLEHDINLSPFSSLDRLQHLQITPFREYGLVDDDMHELTSLTNITTLSLLASPIGFTHQALRYLTNLPLLTNLSLCPVGTTIGANSLEILRSLPKLSCLTLGIEKSSQTVALSQLTWISHLRLKVTDEKAEMGSVLSVCNWCLAHNLRSLQVGTLEVAAVEVLLSVAMLTQLTELKVQFRHRQDDPSHSTPSGDLSALSTLTNMQAFEMLCSHEAPVALSVKGISLLAMQWPYLRSLSLSMVGNVGLMQEAVDLLDNFVLLEELNLFAPTDLDLSCSEPLVEVNLHYLPPHLTSLAFELVQLTWLQSLTNRQSRSLPRLRHLELDSCTLSDDVLLSWAHDLHGLRHLELVSPKGVTDAGVSVVSQLSCLTHITVVGGDNPDITQQSLQLVSGRLKLRHLEWSTDDLLYQVDAENVMPVLCGLTNLHFLSLRTSDPHMTNSYGWRAALNSKLPFCTVTFQHGLHVYNAWEGYRVVVSPEGCD